MKKIYAVNILMLVAIFAHAQFVYNDFDENQNVDFSGWPNAPAVIENPDPSGINTSAMVAEWVRSGEQWAHVYAELDGKIDFSTGHIFELKVWSPIACEVLFKLEDKTNGAIFTEVMQSVAVTEEWVQLSFDFSGAQSDLYDKIVIFFDFATNNDNTFYFDDVVGPEIGDAGEPAPPVTLPVTFDDPDVNYNLIDFGGNISEIVVDPTDESNMVAKTIKTAAAETWAGTTVGGTQGFPEPIPFTPDETTMSVTVWSPLEGSPIRLKVEDSGDPTISVETEVLTTVANDWETLVFDFSNEAPGTAPINFDNAYNKASIFFNFGIPGAESGELTYYWDDMEFGGESDDDPIDDDLFIYNDFDENQHVDFSGWPNAPSVIENPDPSGINTSANVAEWVRSGEQWAHVYAVLDGKIDFSTGSEFNMKVWSPVTCEVLFKLEDKTNAGIFTEVIAEITEVNQWVELVFDFEDAEADMYDKIVIFFDFASFADNTFYFDDVMGPEIGEAEEPAPGVTLPVTFDDPDINYGLVDFGGNVSEIIIDPTDETNMVVQTMKTAGAEFWAGTTVAAGVGFEEPIPFTEDATTMSVRVWAPEAGIPVRLKVEAATDATISVETEATISIAEGWNTLVFDFANEAEGTAPINFDNEYNMASIFFNFGTPGAGETYYWDDMEFGGETDPEPTEFTVTFIVTDEMNNDVGNAVITLGEIVNEAGDYVFENVEAGIYAYSVSSLCYLTMEGELTVEADMEVDITLNLDILPGDANGDGVVNILDVIAIGNYYTGNELDDFCFYNADVNGDGIINSLDIILIINIFLSGK